MRLMENALLDRIIDRRDALVAALTTTDSTDSTAGTLQVVEPPDLDALRSRAHRVTNDSEPLVVVEPVVEPVAAEPVTPVAEAVPLAPTDLDALRARVRGVTTEQEPVQTPAPDQSVPLEEPVPVEEIPAVPVIDALAAAGVWDDGMPTEFSFAECEHDAAHSLQASLRSRVRGDALVAAPKSWSAEERRKAKGKGQTMPDGSFPTVTKADWMRARQSLGRAKNPAAAKRYLKKRAKTLGVPKAEYANL